MGFAHKYDHLKPSSMSELNEQENGEQLFDTETSESATDAAKDTIISEETDKGEQEQEPLNEGKTSAEANREAQIKAWQRKIDAKEVTIDTLPDNVKWVAKYIDPVAAQPKPEVDVDALIEAKLAAKEEETKFKTLKNSLSDVKMSEEQRKDLQVEFDDLRTSGLSKAKALEKAIRLAGISPGDAVTDQLRSKMALPKDGMQESKPVSSDKPYDEARKNMTPEQRVEYLESLRKSKHNISK